MGAATKEGLSAEQVYMSYVRPIRRYLHRLSGNWDLAEDLTQVVFMRAVNQLSAGRQIKYVSAWLYRIARNLYLDHERRAKIPTESLGELGEVPGGPDPEGELLRSETRQEIAKILAGLPESQRSLLLFRDLEGLSYQEIAEVMNTTVNAVKSGLFRARANFRKAYRERVVDSSVNEV